MLVVVTDGGLGAGLQAAMEEEGYSVEVATDGAQTLHALRQRRFALLLLDLLLAESLSVLDTVSADPTLRPAAVLVLATVAQRALLLAALQAGADDYVTSPCTVRELALRLKLWLQRVGRATPLSSAGLRVYSLGGFSVEQGGHVLLQAGSRARKTLTLFKYLLSHQERAVATAEVFDLLWPHTPEERAASNLRSLLHFLRGLLDGSGAGHGPSCLEHTHTTLALRLHPSDWWDVAECMTAFAEGAQWDHAGERARALAAYQRGLALYRGDYLVEEPYAEWALPLRERLREQWLGALGKVAALYGQQGAVEEQEALLHTLLHADPYREQTYRWLLTLLARQGRSAEALVLYRQLEAFLQAEFEVSPDPETQALIAQIRAGTLRSRD